MIYIHGLEPCLSVFHLFVCLVSLSLFVMSSFLVSYISTLGNIHRVKKSIFLKSIYRLNWFLLTLQNSFDKYKQSFCETCISRQESEVSRNNSLKGWTASAISASRSSLQLQQSRQDLGGRSDRPTKEPEKNLEIDPKDSWQQSSDRGAKATP